ncbi:hypothetical protein KAR91_53295 [Candidatus Pacearchaeota archaeon]|nr:hypothetical protein [Candidatus Pacearchaeota archaeon]
MADIVSQFVAASDNANDYSQKQVDDIQQKALEDIDNLMTDTVERDVDLWEDWEIDPNLVITDYEDEELEDRGLDWNLGLSAMAAAATVQFFLVNREPLIINPAAYRRQKLDPFNLTRSQLEQAGRREIIRVPLKTYEKLQSKFVDEFAAIKNLSNKELYSVLNDAGALRSIEKHTADSMGYVSRMTNYPKGSPQWKEAVANLTSAQSKSGLMSMNRRSVETLSVLAQTGGDSQAELTWLLDPTSSHCSYCPANAGLTMTYDEWLDFGLPGFETCKGGDRCNCHLEAAN